MHSTAAATSSRNTLSQPRAAGDRAAALVRADAAGGAAVPGGAARRALLGARARVGPGAPRQGLHPRLPLVWRALLRRSDTASVSLCRHRCDTDPMTRVWVVVGMGKAAAAVGGGRVGRFSATLAKALKETLKAPQVVWSPAVFRGRWPRCFGGERRLVPEPVSYTHLRAHETEADL
eukprot:1331312-Rhodomonas_salina.1